MLPQFLLKFLPSNFRECQRKKNSLVLIKHWLIWELRVTSKKMRQSFAAISLLYRIDRIVQIYWKKNTCYSQYGRWSKGFFLNFQNMSNEYNSYNEKLNEKKFRFPFALMMMKMMMMNWFCGMVDQRKAPALIPAGTIVRDLHHCESSTRREQNLSLRRTWVQT